MTHYEAKKILAESEAEVYILGGLGTALIHGEVTIEELHAILQLLEYDA